MKIYLDACCFSRLTDDQLQRRIREEAEAIESILVSVDKGDFDLISSEVLEDEVRRNPNDELRVEIQMLLSLGTTFVKVDEDITARAKALASLGYGTFDALHLASAESVKADLLLTTDDRFLKRAGRKLGSPAVPVANPLDWKKGRPQ